jgi:hypothetical protein
MKLISLLFALTFLFFSFCSGKDEKADCKALRTGSFMLKLKPEGTQYYISRTDSYQTEFNPATDKIIGFKIKWTDDCEYELVKTYKRKASIVDSSQVQRIIEFKNETALKVRVLEAKGKYYVFESMKEGIDFIYTDTLWRIGGFKSMAEIFQ